MTFVILTKGIDLSVGSTGGAGRCRRGADDGTWRIDLSRHSSVPRQRCQIIGAANGFGVSYWRIPAFITTLGTMVMVRGIALMLADGGTVKPGKAADDFFLLGEATFRSPDADLRVHRGMRSCGHRFETNPFGRAVHAVGSNEEAAHLSGINVPLVTFGVYIIGKAFRCTVRSDLPVTVYRRRSEFRLGLELEAITIAVIGGRHFSAARVPSSARSVAQWCLPSSPTFSILRAFHHSHSRW